MSEMTVHILQQRIARLTAALERIRDAPDGYEAGSTATDIPIKPDAMTAFSWAAQIATEALKEPTP